MGKSRKLAIATIVCLALSGAAWAHPGNGNGGGNGNGSSGNGNTLLQSVINLPMINPPLIHRNSGNSQLAPVVTHRLPSNSITEGPGNRGIGHRGADSNGDPKLDRNDRGPRFDRSERLDNRKGTQVDEKSEKAEKERETRLAANTTDDASGSRKAEANRPQPSCR